jgi:hypothetical protein
MPLVIIRTAAEADLALEENVDTLSLPYGHAITLLCTHETHG